MRVDDMRLVADFACNFSAFDLVALLVIRRWSFVLASWFTQNPDLAACGSRSHIRTITVPLSHLSRLISATS